MESSVTRPAADYFFDLLEQDAAAIREDITSSPMTTTPAVWKEKITGLSRAYSLSSRFALLRLIANRAGASDGDFSLEVQGKTYHFRNITEDRGESLRPEENLACMNFLLDQAGTQADSDPEVDEYILSRAWYTQDTANAVSELLLPEEVRASKKEAKKALAAMAKANKTKYKSPLTRAEAFQLGHILQFSLEEMQWFMLRVFDVADGFRFNLSEDLIEAYGFLTNASCRKVEQLKQQYQERCAGIPKVDDNARNNNWTRDVSCSLQSRVDGWTLQPDTMDRQFLDWMASRASGLDVPSRTACRIYRNLAAFAYDLMIHEENIPEEEDFADCLQDLYEDPDQTEAVYEYLYENGQLSRRCCEDLSKALLLENKIQCASIQKDNTKAWHVLTTRSDGSLTAAGSVLNSRRDRMAEILCGTIQAEKSDMLYLLWFTSNLVWQNADSPSVNDICCRLFDYIDTANYLLKAAMLPHFYPPHIMEQSMLLSIVSGGLSQEEPSVVYEYILSSLTEQREGHSGAKHHSEEFKRQVVEHYQSDEALTLAQCAQLYGISDKTLSAWQLELQKKAT